MMINEHNISRLLFSSNFVKIIAIYLNRPFGNDGICPQINYIILVYRDLAIFFFHPSAPVLSGVGSDYLVIKGML